MSDVVHSHKIYSLHQPSLLKITSLHERARTLLQKSILKEIAAHHSFTQCPLCGEGFSTENMCSLGEKIQFKYSWDAQREQKSCVSCRVIWEIALHNYTKERGDGMITGTSHEISITGYNNCFCQSFVFPDLGGLGVSIHLANGHSRFHLYEREKCAT